VERQVRPARPRKAKNSCPWLVSARCSGAGRARSGCRGKMGGFNPRYHYVQPAVLYSFVTGFIVYAVMKSATPPLPVDDSC